VDDPSLMQIFKRPELKIIQTFTAFIFFMVGALGHQPGSAAAIILSLEDVS
jgi:hypothetical protein